MAANETGNRARKPEGVSGLHNLRTALRARVKSKPEVEGQVHLDMYRLTRQRVMWVRLQQQAAQNLGTIQGELKRSLGKLKAEIATEDGAPASGAPEDKSAERYGDFRVRF